MCCLCLDECSNKRFTQRQRDETDSKFITINYKRDMKNRLFTIFLLLATCFGAAWAQVSVKQVVGWYESAYVTWELYQGADMYNVYVKGASDTNWKQLDEDLIRNYGWYGRADAVGLKPGNYQFKIEATKSGSVISGSATETKTISVQSYDRDGFAHKDGVAVGAYNNDGTLKENARVLYINKDNVDNVQLSVMRDSEELFTGLGDILKAYEKGAETRPLAIRIIGNVNTTSGQLYGDADAMQLKGKNNTIPMQVTIEGVGDDAWLSDWGFVFVKANNVEMRNLGIALFNDDGISIKESVKMWVHHCDIFYGKAGSASDQAKGDGSLDVKDDSQYCTFSYVHFWDSGKMSLCGMKSESGPNYISYHHNWFDHSDSRHPRIRTMTVHIYNNYYDGVAKYGVGVTSGSSAFVENNYFRNTNRPMMSSKQGTDASGDGTFSDESGGMIKSYGNIFVECSSNFSYITANSVEGSGATKVDATSFDAYQASSRNEQVPSSYETLAGGTTYNNFDTNSSLMYTYTPDATLAVPAKVKASAGRMQGGDFTWRGFDNSIDDADYDVNSDLMSAIRSYETTLVEIAAFTQTTSAPASYTVTYYADVEGTIVFDTQTDQTKLVYPKNTPTKEGYTFVGWSAAQGQRLSSDLYVYPTFTDGKNSEGGTTGGGEVVAKKWDFTSWSSETQAAVTSNSSVWVKESDGINRYDATFSEATDLGFAETEGITFQGSVRISWDTSKGQYLQGSFTMNVPVSEGQKLTFVFANTGNSNGTRNLIVEGEPIASSESTSKVEATYTVPAGKTSIVVKGSGGLNYYTITVSEDASELEKPTFAFSASTASADMAPGATNTYPTLQNNSDGTVTYSSSNQNVATVDGEGNITLVGIGQTTIRATVSATDTYQAASAQYVLTVTDSSIPTYTVTFMVDNEVYVEMEGQTRVNYPEENPVKAGYTFTGWDVPEGTILTSDLTVNATWKEAPTYTVTFMVDDAVFASMENQTVVVYPEENPVKDGYVFTGWDVPEGTILTGNLTVNASFTELSASSVTIEAGTFPVGYTLDGATSASVYSYNSETSAAKLIPIEDGQHAVTVPGGLYVSKVTFIGCTQNNDPKGHIVEFNGQSCSYQLTDRKAATFTEVVFDGLNIQGGFTFTVDYNCAVKILLEVNAGTDAVSPLMNENMIRYNGREVSADGTILVYNVQGVLVKSGARNVDLSNLARGIYIVRCGNEVMKIGR